MKSLFVASLLIVSGASIAQTSSYRLTSHGQHIGTMQDTDVYTSTRHTDHSDFKILANGKEFSMVTEEVETAQGDWISKSMKVSGGGTTGSLVATPTATGAHIVMEGNGKHQTMEIPRISKMTTRNPTIAWFRVRMPKVGETVSYQRFDVQTQKWSEVTLKYVGPTSVQIGGKTRHGFAVQKIEGGKTESGVVDQSNELMKYDSGDMAVERVYK
jgi:hypothetical protein